MPEDGERMLRFPCVHSADKFFVEGIRAYTPRNPVEGAHSIHYTVHHSIHYTIHCDRTLVEYQLNNVNWSGGQQNGHARIRVHGSISADRSLFPVFKLPF
ncbi:hypothetical protein Y032_0385g429 [Ancylostoma ceylanicum]|uniref:Uncharacterized protein n=1 Tax=Ancylostoma ceylanicum TaxID=53326 RepID=A0A016RSU6_9BILA|nr:hypothetical protein Y032_0385g429 [Ancylostoma ceylanicum]